MAKDKKGFILYADLIKVVSKLPNETAGKLFKIILSYVNDLEVSIDDLLLEIAFEPIKNQLKRDLVKFEQVKSKRSDAGKRSAELRALKKEEQNPTNSTSVESVQQTSTNPTVTVNDIVTDNVTDIYTTYIEEPTQTNNITEEVFLKRWCDARTYYDKLPTNIKRLTSFEKIDFADLRRDYTLLEFEQAMKGLFQQKTFPKTRLRPSHFLKREHFETYLTCFTTNEKLYEDNKYKKQIERI
tara:strand:+ start:343 stop:1065 length:723 start_codon:yes stop_codon:yes gene_type:complete